MQVRGTGIWNGSTTLPAIQVTSIAAVPTTFSIGGGGSIGSELDFTAFGNVGDTAIVVLSYSDSFLPIQGFGVLFLAPQSMIVLGQGPIESNGEFEVEVQVPNIPALIGFKVFAQAGLIGPSGTRLTNSDLKTIKA
jgi:hypothetical protein